MKRVLIILTLLIFLGGCWDRVEIENRGFVVSLGLDKYKAEDNAVMFQPGKADKRYTVTMSLPNVSELVGTGSKENAEYIKIAADETVAAAMRLVESYSSEKLYFGQTKAVLLGEGLLKDEALFSEAVDALERNRELSRKMLILATTDGVDEVLNAKITGEPLVGVFLADFYRNKKNAVAMTFRRDLESVIRDLSFNGSALIPRISLKGDKENPQIELGGAAVIRDFKLAGWLDNMQTRGYLWFKGHGEGAELVTEYNGSHIPLRINSSATKVYFREDAGKITCHADVKLKAAIEEFKVSGRELSDADLSELSRAYEGLVRDEITRLFDMLRLELDVDGFGLCELLRKENYGLYQSYGEDSDVILSCMELSANVSLKITGAGVIK